ncbi:MAG: right-handed parallel beta-helix repeat-containing protein [Thermoguttaceae bacterium]|nr:right-handed parallel beta-helix repeat-containing protein [Thermoguttaceae bacterium]
MKFSAFLPAFLLGVLSILSAVGSFAQNPALDDARIEKKGDFFVSPDGNDSWSGTSAIPNANQTDGPFATLEKAQNAVRDALQTSPAAYSVTVAEGIYELPKTFALEKNDSGKESARITWQAEKGKEVILSAGTILNNWKTVDDPKILNQLDESVRGKIVMVDLKAAGITNFGSPKGGGIELFFDGTPMQLSRYPNEGFVKITSVNVNKPVDVRGTKGDKVGIFQFEDERILKWTKEKDPWVHGYWFWDWSEERHPIAEIIKESKTLKVKPPYHSYGYRKNQWFYGFNLLCEIDMPGEYYVDRESGILYFYPPKEIRENSMAVSRIDTLVKINADYVTFQGFTLEFSRGTALTMNGSHDLVVGLTVRNVSGTGISASGTNQTIYGCHLFNLGKSGISIHGGDRKTLTPSGNLISNNEIHDYARIQRVYAPGISLNGVGNTASHNKIYDAPHMGIGFSGNDNLIEFNEISNVCFESNDAGAIYTGRNWTMRGNVLRFNLLKDIQGFENRGCVGIYLDDQFSSAEMFGNIFVNVTRAAMIGGGRDCQIVNNLFINCQPCVHLDARGLGWQKEFTANWIKELSENGVNCGIKITEPPYSTRYPELLTILTNHPGTPVGNVITKNVCLNSNFGNNHSGQWRGTSIWANAEEFNTIKDNFTKGDPMIEDWENGNFTLKAESPALKTGFQQIPWQKIGLKKDQLQAK